MKLTACFAIILLGLAGSTAGQDVLVNRPQIIGLTEDGLIPAQGGDLIIPIHMTNVYEVRAGISNGFSWTSDFGEVEWALMRFNPRGVPFDPPEPPEFDGFASNSFVGCYTSSGLPLFDQVTVCTYDNGGGVYCDASMVGTGLPADFDDVAYEIELIGVHGPPGAQLTLDSAWFPPDIPWFWSDAEEVSWGGPYTFTVEGPSLPFFTTCWPQPVELGVNDNDGILEIYIHGEDVSLVDLSSVRVFDKIPPETQEIAWIEGDVIVTDCNLMRFLGMGGFRPLPDESFVGDYTVTYRKEGGITVTLGGKFAMTINPVDVNLDGSVGPDDIQFLRDFLFNRGSVETVSGFPTDELMDVDRSGRVDLLDLNALVRAVYR